MLAITCALFSEAKPLIEKLDLKLNSQTEKFKLYSSNEYVLIITGVGVEKAAIAIGYLFGKYQNISALINIGIAGHKNLNIGELVLIAKANYKEKPPLFPLYPRPFQGIKKELETVDYISDQYPDNKLYDMEGYAVLFAASQFLSFELVHSIKIISDNSSHHPLNIDKNKVEFLIKNKIEEILQLLQEIQKISLMHREYTTKPEISSYLPKLHLTVTEKHLLINMISRLQTLQGDISIPNCKNSKELFAILTQRVKERSL